jgi:hypothetical protein
MKRQASYASGLVRPSFCMTGSSLSSLEHSPLVAVGLLLQHGCHMIEDQATKDKSYKSREELSSITINVECLIVSAVDTT